MISQQTNMAIALTAVDSRLPVETPHFELNWKYRYILADPKSPVCDFSTLEGVIRTT